MPVVGYEGFYEVSNTGIVRSVRRRVQFGSANRISKGVILKVQDNGMGYKMVVLSVNNISRKHYIHRLVAMSFIPNPNNYKYINHKDEVKENNHFSNLEWCTAKYNIRYGSRNSKCLETRRINNLPNKEKKTYQYSLDGEYIKEYPSAEQAAREIGCMGNQIQDVCRGRPKCISCCGFMWSYEKHDRLKPYKNKQKRMVAKYTLELELIKVYKSIRDAANDLGVSSSSIHRCCNNKRDIINGVKFRYFKL